MKTLLIGFFLFSVLGMHAQTEKGNWMLDGSANMFQNKYQPFENQMPGEITKNGSRGLSITPGCFIKDKLLVGIGPSYSVNKYISTSSNSELNYTSIVSGLTVLARKYMPLKKNFFLTAQAEMGGGLINRSTYQSQNNQTSNQTSKGYSLKGGFAFGIAWFPTRRFGFNTGVSNVGVSYQTTNSGSDNINPRNSKTERTDFNFSLNTLALQVGISYLFNSTKTKNNTL